MTEMGYCNATYKWLSLHAGVYVEAGDRDGLRQLLRDTSRSAVSPSRLSYVDPDEPETSNIRLALKRAWSDGTRELEFSQVDLVERLASLVPEPWSHLTPSHSIFAPGHAWRDFMGPGRRRLPRTMGMETELGEARNSDDESQAKKKSSSGRAPALVTLSKAKGLLLSWGILRKAQDGVSLQCQDD